MWWHFKLLFVLLYGLCCNQRLCQWWCQFLIQTLSKSWSHELNFIYHACQKQTDTTCKEHTKHDTLLLRLRLRKFLQQVVKLFRRIPAARLYEQTTLQLIFSLLLFGLKKRFTSLIKKKLNAHLEARFNYCNSAYLHRQHASVKSCNLLATMNLIKFISLHTSHHLGHFLNASEHWQIKQKLYKLQEGYYQQILLKLNLINS